MTVLRNLTLLLLLVITAHTLATIANQGWDFVTVFLTDITSLTWHGQFALDFMSYLVLSGLWVAWRGGFTLSSVSLGVVCALMGLVVFGCVLLLLISRSGNDMRKLLLGVHATAQPAPDNFPNSSPAP